MKYGHAKRLRALIEQMATALTDTEALEGIELFPQWQNETTYAQGDRVRYSDALFKCLQAHTSQSDWTPDVAVSLWVAVADPSIEFPDWVQPTGGHDAYNTGDKVTYDSKHWVSTVDNNVWMPGVYGWDEVA